VVWGVAALALAAIAYLALKPAPAKELPDFRLPLLTRGTLSSEDLRGSPVVLNFFASWCTPCRDEAPVLERAWKRYESRGVRFVGVYYEDTPGHVKHFVGEFGITYPIVRDDDKRLARALGVYGLPQTFFVGEDWRLLESAKGKRVGSGRGQVAQLGAISEGELERRVQQLLAG
jgi:cytochrome c biogenesis protein CcmG, thiol:disulfide interchange protein DsbE